MKIHHFLLFGVITLLVSCTQQTPEMTNEPVEEIEEPDLVDIEPEVEEPQEPIVEEPEEIEPEEPLVEEPAEELQTESNIPEDVQKVFDYSKTKLKSYSYIYKDPLGPQYQIYVKGNKIRISLLSSKFDIYLDTEKKTAEKYCITYSKCIKETGKIEDLNYEETYIETPVDWLDKITEATKIDEFSYLGKQSYRLKTNIGEVIIDSNFGFVQTIKGTNITYSFSEPKYNIVKDSDVIVPPYLLET